MEYSVIKLANSLLEIDFPLISHEIARSIFSTLFNNIPDSAESGILLNKVEKIDRAISWDIKGKSISSKEFANLITEYSMNDHQIEFVIGGSHGLSNEVLDKSNHVISASKLTFPHRLFKIILSEQIYRACSIISNHPYHK